MIIVLKPNEVLTPENLTRAREEYSNYIKITADITQGIVALGGEYHADAEKLLLEQGSQQENIWGGGIDLTSKIFAVNAMINIRPDQNNSTDILDPNIRQRFLTIVQQSLKNYV